MKCQAEYAESIIKSTGRLVGHTLHIDRDINCEGATEISGNTIVPLPKLRAKIDADNERTWAEYRARQEKRAALIEAGVSEEDAYDATKL